MNRLTPEAQFWRRPLKVPRLVCWGFAIGCLWLAARSLGSADSVFGITLTFIAMVAAVPAVLESGREIDSASPAFRTFWLLLSALILPIVLAAVLLLLNVLIARGSAAPLVTFALWVTVHFPFAAFIPRRTDSLIRWLTVAQWAIIAVLTHKLTRDWRIYEAIVIAFATILTVGIAIIIGLLLIGYRLQFEGP